MDLCKLTANELQNMLRSGEVSSLEITESVFEQIKEVEDDIGAYITLTEELAKEQAKAVDEMIAQNDELPALAGIPIAIKDVICTKDILTTCGSQILKNFIPPYDATIMKKLNEQKIVMTGKTNMDEFAMGSSTENSSYKITRNPWDLERIPGGSSGGSAAAVAANECICSLGSDTGGSIRQPAALCGVVGMKPTYGRVSRYGLIAFASSLDQIGPFTKDVTDCALMMNAICGHDQKDSTSANLEVPDFTKSLVDDVSDLKIGIPKEYFIEGLDSEVEEKVRTAIDVLANLGADVQEISLPNTDYAVATYYIIAPAEASANLARYDGVRYGFRAEDADNLIDMYKKTRSEGFGPEVKRRIMLGTYALSSGYYDAYYLKAQKVRTLVKEDFDSAFEKVDVIVTPTSPTPAFKIGEKMDEPLQMYLSDIFTISTNLSGIPGISIPCGFTEDKLPVGLQIMANAFDEETLIRVAYTYEKNRE